MTKHGQCNDGCSISVMGNAICCGMETWHYTAMGPNGGILVGPMGQRMRNIPNVEAAFYAVAGAHGGLRWSI